MDEKTRKPVIVAVSIILILFLIAVVAYIHYKVNEDYYKEHTTTESRYEGINVETILVWDDEKVATVLYPSLENTNINSVIEDYAKTEAEEFKTDVDEYKKKNNIRPNEEKKYELNINFDTEYATDDYVSFVFDRSKYVVGDQYALNSYKTFNFNRVTAELISVKQVFNQDSDYLRVLSEYTNKDLHAAVDKSDFSVDEKAKLNTNVDDLTKPEVDSFQNFTFSAPDNTSLINFYFANPVGYPNDTIGKAVVINLSEVDTKYLNIDEVKKVFPNFKSKDDIEEENSNNTSNSENNSSGSENSDSSVTVVPPANSADVDCNIDSCVALTFDDGPEANNTPFILDTLKSHNAHATFFVLGTRVTYYPAILQRMINEGNEIGNHTWDHQQLTLLTPEQIQAEVNQTQDAVYAAVGSTPTVMRPPYGAYDSTVQSNVGMPLILWSIDTLDWQTLDTQATINTVLTETKRNSIVLMHDIHKTTADGIPQIVEGLQSKGFKLVTVTTLIGNKPPGTVVTSGG
ncbi:polysaccharide deacetylase family protein [Candidatus Dojkabacteria bacterium]|uniref:Polysaccharide deacetylase family protein n=1 Tax=Candidatus Dojkabacteria bacterium TaxID=2099670 RepID=A0A955L3X7_9BACT|nr:polysaccharide deacetylase family protein [Candidatus Dojkabacteria bacterium]